MLSHVYNNVEATQIKACRGMWWWWIIHATTHALPRKCVVFLPTFSPYIIIRIHTSLFGVCLVVWCDFILTNPWKRKKRRRRRQRDCATTALLASTWYLMRITRWTQCYFWYNVKQFHVYLWRSETLPSNIFLFKLSHVRIIIIIIIYRQKKRSHLKFNITGICHPQTRAHNKDKIEFSSFKSSYALRKYVEG